MVKMIGEFFEGIFKNKEIKQYMEIIELNIETQKLVDKRLDTIRDSVTNLQNAMLDMAKNVAQHKQVIAFLLNNSTFEENAQKDLMKMLKDINSLNKKVTK